MVEDAENPVIPWHGSLTASLLYLLASVLFFGRGLSGHLSTVCIGREVDPPMFIWFLRWWQYALDHRINPFVTDRLWAPLGFDLAWTTFIPLPALIAMPLVRTAGETVAYNFLGLMAAPLAAFSAFLLCRKVTGALWPAIISGYIFGFSPYGLAEMLGGHLHLVYSFPVPLLVLIALRRIDLEISMRRFVIYLSLLLTILFLCSVELFATVTLMAGFSLLLALALFKGETRVRLVALIAPMAGGYLVAMASVCPYLYYLFAYGYPHGPIWTPDRFSADLLGFFVPVETFALGTVSSAREVTQLFTANLPESGAYLGIPLIVFIEIFRRQYWASKVGKFLVILLLLTVVIAIGPVLHIAGRETIAMPWAIFTKLPLISSALPIRFSMYAFLVVAVMLARWLARAPVRNTIKYLVVAIILLSWTPNLSASFWLSRLELPLFFTRGTYRNVLAPGEIVLALPFEKKGNSMYWQAKSDMYFRMSGAWTGVVPFAFARMPIVNFFEGADDLPEPIDQLKSYIAHFEVGAILVDPLDERFPIFRPVLAGLDLRAAYIDGIWIYKIPPGDFAAYSKLGAPEVEARAATLRFDTILAAAAKYLADGRDPTTLSPLSLERLGLLPADWHIGAGRYPIANWSIGTVPDGRTAIALSGSYEGLRPLIDRYSAGAAAEIQYPAPARWNPQSRPLRDQLAPILIIFDRAQLEAASRLLKLSPPPEATTPFTSSSLTQSVATGGNPG